LANRSFGGAQVSRTFYARGQTGQQLLLGAYSALIAHDRCRGSSRCYTHVARCSISVVVDGQAKGIIVRNLVRRATSSVTRPTRWCWRPAATATCSTSPPTPAVRNATAIWRAYKRGACFANPCYTQIHPTCIPVSGDYQSKLTLMSRVAA
jgi:succinate dehydrogenase / fumarate reductase flavoprotein subunit